MKKRIGLATFGLVALLSGCSESDEEGVTLDVWAIGWEAEQLVNEGYVKAFEEENPGVKVNLQAIPWGNIYDNLLTAVASGNGPEWCKLGLLIWQTLQAQVLFCPLMITLKTIQI